MKLRAPLWIFMIREAQRATNQRQLSPALKVTTGEHSVTSSQSKSKHTLPILFYFEVGHFTADYEIQCNMLQFDDLINKNAA
jgi:hypothetical protein